MRRRLYRHAPLTAMLYSTYSGYSLWFTSFETRVNLARIATALKLYKLKYGSYPESLKKSTPYSSYSESLKKLTPDFISELLQRLQGGN